MGSTASKAAGSTARKLPTTNAAARLRQSPSPSAAATASRAANAAPSKASRSEAPQTTSRPPVANNNNSEGADAGLNERLRRVGPVQPNPTYSNSSTFNQAAEQQQQQGNGFIPSASSPTQSIFPTSSSPSSSSSASQKVTGANPALTLLVAREQLARAAESEFEEVARVGTGYSGRRFLDVSLLRQVLVLRDQVGLEPREIERRLGLKKGTVDVLGRKGVVASVGMMADD